jgi:hypothetical protein
MNTTKASTWPGMSVDEYAALETGIGAKLERSGGVWWRQVRPYFYRPLLPFLELDPANVELPRRARIGGAQYAVAQTVPANSHVDLLMFDEPQSYSLDMLSQGSRRHIRRAMNSFDVRRIEDVEEFITSGHSVYLSFFERTKYGYKRERTDPQRFANWARSLFRFDKVQVLGAYRGGELMSVSVSYVVEGVAFTATFFSRSDALKDYVAELMLHAIRERAAVSENVSAIFAAAAGMERGLDDFYLRRGARLISKAAQLKLNPFVSVVLKTLRRGRHRKLGIGI